MGVPDRSADAEDDAGVLNREIRVEELCPDTADAGMGEHPDHLFQPGVGQDLHVVVHEAQHVSAGRLGGEVPLRRVPEIISLCSTTVNQLDWSTRNWRIGGRNPPSSMRMISTLGYVVKTRMLSMQRRRRAPERGRMITLTLGGCCGQRPRDPVEAAAPDRRHVGGHPDPVQVLLHHPARGLDHVRLGRHRGGGGLGVGPPVVQHAGHMHDLVRSDVLENPEHEIPVLAALDPFAESTHQARPGRRGAWRDERSSSGPE